MYSPSLSFLLCLAVPFLGLWLAKRQVSPLRIYLTLAALLAVATAYIHLAEYMLGAARKTSWLLTTTLKHGGPDSDAAITVQLDPALPLVTAGLLVLAALIIWLQARNNALCYPRFTGWLAAPLTLFAAAPELLLISIPYISGMLSWNFAAPSVKACGILGITGLVLFGLALLGFLLQVLISLIKHLRA